MFYGTKTKIAEKNFIFESQPNEMPGLSKPHLKKAARVTKVKGANTVNKIDV